MNSLKINLKKMDINPIARFAKKKKMQGYINVTLNRPKKEIKDILIKLKEWWKEYRTSLKCERCGENRFWVLEFHHQNPSEKEHNISDLTNKGYSIKTILKEVNKCIVLCANCHRDHHYQEKINQ